MRRLMVITKALADENRVRILGALEGGELCVCQIIELLGLAPSTISKHLSLLRNAELVDARKDGRWVYYGLAARGASKTVRRALAMVRDALSEERTAKEDKRRLKAILKTDPELLCCRQRDEVPGEGRRHGRVSASASRG